MTGTEDYKLTLWEEDMKWLTGDSVGVFVSGRGHKDTLRMEVYEEVFPPDQVTGKLRKDAPSQVIRCDIIRRDSSRIVVTMCIERIDRERVDTYLKFEIIDDLIREDYRDIRFINRRLEPAVINSANYGECIVIDKWDSDNLPYYSREKGNNVERAIWSKGRGLVYYQFEDGEEFTRIPE